MAFNFNWTPLTTTSTTSSAFYTHAKSLLTAALNKSQKPPIIVDDIFVEELNLGQSAPDLEILEIGDLAEDRFRGIFRMNYEGDASLTLRTKVQANPLNTYLSTTPAYTSPTPLAASSPLTIPLQITLSDFRLSGFIILVFSKAKGITLVFRNDPLESLKVSSTFDSIPFIKEYLQKEIERQVRGLFQEELPVAVHRLSLRLWNPEYAASLGLDTPASNTESTAGGTDEELAEEAAAAFVGINPLLSPSDNSDSPSISFSQKNLDALKALSGSQKTLSVGTTSIPHVVFRAWASGGGSSTTGGDKTPTLEPPGTPTSSGSSTYTFSDNGDAMSTAGSSTSRTSSYHASSSLSVSGAAGRTRGKRRKHRVVNLRPQPAAPSVEIPAIVITEKEPIVPQEEEPKTPTGPRRSGVRFKETDPVVQPPSAPIKEKEQTIPIMLQTPPSTASSMSTENITFPSTSPTSTARNNVPNSPNRGDKKPQLRAGLAHGSGILERAFLMKLAGEMQRRLEEERKRRGESEDMWQVERELGELGREAPPAYGAH